MSVPLVCPRCKAEIPLADVNVATDVALCRACNQIYSLAALRDSATLDAGVDLATPPAGAWIRDDGVRTRIGASARSLAGALGLLAISLFWNGIVSVFVLVVLASTLTHMGVTLPHWFPAPKMNGSPMSIGMTIFMWIFLSPFILVGTCMLGAFVTCLVGRSEVCIEQGRGEVFTGIGSLGFRKAFDPVAVRQVRLEHKQWRDSDGDRREKRQIVLDAGDRTIKFGSMLPEARMRFVASALAKTLAA